MEHVVRIPFEEALRVLKDGEMIAREDWEYGEFVFIGKGSVVKMSNVLTTECLPKKVKEWLLFNDKDNLPENQGLEEIQLIDSLCMRLFDGSIVNGWLPTFEDLFSDDWHLYI